MDKGDAQRLLELEFGHVVDHGFHALDGLIDGEGGVVVVFEMDKEYRGEVFGDGEVEVVFPVHVQAQAVVVAMLGVVVE